MNNAFTSTIHTLENYVHFELSSGVKLNSIHLFLFLLLLLLFSPLLFFFLLFLLFCSLLQRCQPWLCLWCTMCKWQVAKPRYFRRFVCCRVLLLVPEIFQEEEGDEKKKKIEWSLWNKVETGVNWFPSLSTQLSLDVVSTTTTTEPLFCIVFCHHAYMHTHTLFNWGLLQMVTHCVHFGSISRNGPKTLSTLLFPTWNYDSMCLKSCHILSVHMKLAWKVDAIKIKCHVKMVEGKSK